MTGRIDPGVDEIDDHSYYNVMKPQIFIGTSGWNYKHWKGIFYDADCPKSQWLDFYARYFSTVEVNATFYRLPSPETFENWRLRTPDNFLWAVKASRYITHVKRLREPDDSLARFFGVARFLKEKLGPVLFQLPPSLVFDEREAAKFCRSVVPYNHRCVMEVRHPSWLEDTALALLEKSNIALCVSDTAGRYPYCEAIPADFVYIRLHGSRKLYASDYTEEELTAWARKIEKWDRDTYLYFDNDFEGYAPKNAIRLKEILARS